jgi:threonine synthase
LSENEANAKHLCLACGKEPPDGFHPFCSACGGMVDVQYALEKVKLADSPNPYVRFAELLPLSMLHCRLPEAAYTPFVHATRLGRKLCLTSIFLKDETVLPTRSTKARMASVSLAYMRERGVRGFCASSTGNSGTAFAYGIRAHPEMHLFLFTAEDFVGRVQHADHSQVTHFGVLDASFAEAAEFASTYARRHGLVSESGFFNPGRREGLKLAFLEASEQAPRPIDWYVQAVSSAMGIYGAHKGAKELLLMKRIARTPRLLCVQQESCAPMARAYAESSEYIRPEHLVARPTGIAQAILRGDPTRAYPHVRRVVKESGGDFTAVTEVEIREARRLIEDEEGLSPCFSASAAVAGVVKLARKGAFSRDSLVVINLTGGDRTEAGQAAGTNIEWLDRTPCGWHARPPAEAVFTPTGQIRDNY